MKLTSLIRSCLVTGAVFGMLMPQVSFADIHVSRSHGERCSAASRRNSAGLAAVPRRRSTGRQDRATVSRGEVVASSQTDREGRFAFRGLRAGVYGLQTDGVEAGLSPLGRRRSATIGRLERVASRRARTNRAWRDRQSLRPSRCEPLRQAAAPRRPIASGRSHRRRDRIQRPRYCKLSFAESVIAFRLQRTGSRSAGRGSVLVLWILRDQRQAPREPAISLGKFELQAKCDRSDAD